MAALTCAACGVGEEMCVMHGSSVTYKDPSTGKFVDRGPQHKCSRADCGIAIHALCGAGEGSAMICTICDAFDGFEAAGEGKDGGGKQGKITGAEQQGARQENKYTIAPCVLGHECGVAGEFACEHQRPGQVIRSVRRVAPAPAQTLRAHESTHHACTNISVWHATHTHSPQHTCAAAGCDAELHMGCGTLVDERDPSQGVLCPKHKDQTKTAAAVVGEDAGAAGEEQIEPAQV